MFKTKKQISRTVILFLVLSQCGLFTATPAVFAATNIGNDITSGGNLTIEGALKFVSGAVGTYILTTDGSGNASWTSVGSALGNATADDLPQGATNTYYNAADVDARADAQINAQKGAPNGLATLNGSGQIPVGQIPALAINETYVAADIPARDALTPNKGDVVIVTNAGGGESRSYIWDGTAWIELLTPLQLYLAKSNNLSDLSNPAAAKTNLGLGTASSPTFTGLSLTGLTSGSLLFSGPGGVTSQDNANLFWDDVSKRLGINTNTPAYALDVNGDIKVGDGSLLVLGSGADPDPVGTNGSIYYNTTTDQFRCYQNGLWKDCITAIGAGGAVVLSSVASAVAANTINNADYAQRWNWSLTSPDQTAFTFGENVATTSTGAPTILKASTLTSSTAIPLLVDNIGNGNSFRVNDSSGDITPFLIDETGNVGIGTNSFDPVNPERLKVDSGDFPSFNIITATGNLDNYLQMNIRNRNSGGNASSDIVATADNGTETVNYIDMGINSSGYSDPDYSIGGPNDAYLYAQGVDALTPGGNLALGTGATGKAIKFHTGGTTAADERMRIDGDGKVGIATTSPGSELDVKGTLRLSGATSGFVGFAPAAAAGSTTYTFPTADGTSGQVLSTDGSGTMSWINPTGVWQRIGTVLSPTTAGDGITTSGNISTSGTGTITSAALLTGNAGAAISGATTNINTNSNFDTNINTGTSTGAVTVGNSGAGAINMTSGSSVGLTSGTSLNLTGGTSAAVNTTAGDITMQPSGSGTTAYLQVGVGGLGSATPDLLALDVKSTAGDPVAGQDGSMYYNEILERFRCYVNGSWSDCDTTGGSVTLQSAYNSGATITTSAATDLALTLTSGNFTASGAGSVNLTPTGASSFTSGGALTLTGGAASTWSTSTGALTLMSAADTMWGTAAGDLTLQANGSATGGVHIGADDTPSATPDIFSLDRKSVAAGTGDPLGGDNGDMYYNDALDTFRCYEAGGWKDCGATAASATTLQQAYVAGPTITTTGSTDVALLLSSGNFTASGTGSVNLTPTGASSFTSGGVLTLTGGAASTWGTTAGNLSLQAAGTGTTAGVQIGAGGVGSITPDLLAVDVKSNAGDPAGFNGAMYYNAIGNRFRCYENGAWKDCDAGVVASLQTAYNNGGTVTTSGGNPIAYTLTAGDFTATGAGSVSLTPTGASSFTSGGALTLTGGATSTWGTTSGNVHLQAAGAGTTGVVQIGAGGAGSITPDLLGLDIKSDAGDPAGSNGQMYYNASANKFRCFENGGWLDCSMRSIGTAKGDLITYTASNSPVRLPVGSNGQVLVSDSTQATGLRWVNQTVTPNSLDFAQFSDAMTVDGNTSINLAGKNLTFNDLTGGGGLTLTTNAAALTLTAGSASTWSTSSGALTLDSAAALNLGTTNATSLNLGRAGGGAINLTSPSGVNLRPFGAVAGNTGEQRFLELLANGVNYVAFKAPDSLAANNTYVLPNAYPAGSGYSLISDTSGNLSWTNVGGVLSGWTDGGTTVNLTTSTDNVLVGAGGAATAKMEITPADGNALRINPYGSASGNTGGLQFVELATNGTNYVGFKAPDNIAANVTWLLPSADGTNGQVLTTNGAGGLSWASAGAGAVSSVFGRTGAVMAVSTDYTTLTALTNLSSAAATALTIDSGTTGALNIGTGAASKTITIGNSTGTTGLVLDAGTAGVKIGDPTATAITKHLSTTASLNFPLLDGTCSSLTVTLTGAVAGDTVVATPTPVTGGIETGTDSLWQGYVSSANTVAVRACDANPAGGGLDPAIQTWRVDVWQH